MDGNHISRIDGVIKPSLALFCALIAPVMLYAVGQAPLNRWLYPASSLMLSGYLYYKCSPWYIGYCVWLFCATPLVRRLADQQSGWDASNPILLAPYFACALAAISLFRLRRPHGVIIAPFAIVLACIGFGFILAALNGRVLSGMVDAMKWSAGPLVAVHLLAHPDKREAIHRVVVTSFLIAAPPMAAYGVAQYIDPAPWDATWMIGVAGLGMNSIGHPVPYELRVFSTMNSPGPFAIMLAIAILAALQQQRRFLIVLPTVLLMVLGMLLSQYRAVWAGTLLGAGILSAYGSTTTKVRVLLAMVAMLLVAGSATAMPEIRRAIVERVETLTQLDADASGEDRLHQYDSFLARSDSDQVIGEGLAVDGPSRRLDHGNTVIVDSGIIVVFMALGLFVGTAFMFGLIGVVCLTFRRAARQCRDMPFYRAVIIATFSQLPFGAIHVGESGFGAWVFAGLAASAVAAGMTEKSPRLIQVSRG